MFHVEQHGDVEAFPSPANILRVNLKSAWSAPGMVEATSVRWMASILDIKNAWPAFQRTHLQPQWQEKDSVPLFFFLPLPVDRLFLERVERHRKGAGSVSITVEGSIEYRQLRPENTPVNYLSASMVCRPQESSLTVMVNIDRDKWNGLLKSLAFEEYKIFEVPVRELRRPEKFSLALKVLDDTERAFRNGDWTTTVTNARIACEMLGTIADPEAMESQDPKRAFDSLTKYLFPLDHDAAKRKLLNDLIGSLAHVRGESTKGRSLHFQVEREDAELAFTVAIAVFRYVGEALGRAARNR